ncbi:MAG: hypothetical protein NTZ64_04895 [Polaromonas sp.]|nr:hypothetical protein [Polaromonas sp.]
MLSNLAYAVIDVNNSLSPINILTNQTSTLNLTLLNSASVAATGLAFTNNFPAGMVVQSVTSNSCGGTLTAAVGSSSVVMAGGTIPATVGSTTGQCVIILVVKATAPGTMVDVMAAGSVTTTNQGSNPTLSNATLTASTPSPLTATKIFGTAYIHGGGGTSVVTITLSNPNLQNLNGVAFIDTLPTGVAIASVPAASTTCTSGTLTAVAGAGSASLAGAIIVGKGSCTITFKVTAATPNVASNGTVVNTIAAGGVTSLEGATNGSTINSGNLSVQTGGNLLKAFSPTSILANGIATSTLTLTLQNRNLTALTGVTLTDSFPAGMVVAAAPTGAATTCTGGSVSATPGAGSITLSGATVPAAGSADGATGSCTVTVKVVANTGTAGTLTNSMSGNFGDAAATAYPATSAGLTTTAPAVSVSSKTFSPTTEAPGGTSTLTLTLSNQFGSNAAITSFTDNLLSTMGAGFSVAASPAASTTCPGGTVVAAPGATTISMSTGAIPAATLATTPGTCTITVPIQLAASGLTAGGKTNTIAVGGLVTSLASNTASTTATLTVALPTVAKAFSPNPAAVGPNSTLTITLTNSSATAAAITSFSDNLNTMGGSPGGFQIAAGASTTCASATLTATAGTTLISLAGGTIPANANCKITVPIQVLAGTPAGLAYTNTVASGALVTSRGTSSGTTTAALTVTASGLTKVFSPTTQAAGLASTLTITLNNPSTLAATISSLTDNLTTMGAGFTVAASPAASSTCTGNNLSAAVGGTSITMTAGTIPASASCTITVPVQIDDTVAAGTYTNTIAVGALVTSAGSNTTAATTTLKVIVPSISKVFNPASAGPGPNTTLIITLTNPSSDPALISGFTDLLTTMGAGFTVAASPVASSTCVGNNLSATPGGTAITMTAGTIPALGSCTITVPVQIPSSVTSGTNYTNTIAVGALKTDQGNNTVKATAALKARLPSVAKTVSSGTVVQGQSTTFTITLQNSNNPTPATITSFTDSLTTMDGTGKFVVASSPAATSTCVGNNLSATPGGTSITLTAGTIPANGSCTITVPVLPLATIAPGTKTNTIAVGALQTSQGSNTQAVSQAVTVNPALTCGKAYSPTSVGPSQLSTLTVTLTHANNAPAFTGLSFTDTLPAGQSVATFPNVVSTCGGTLTAASGSSSIALVNGSLPTGATSCTVSVDIKAPATLGTTTNTLPAPTSAQGYTCSSSPTAALTVSAATATSVFVNKGFAPSSINGGGTSLMTLVVDNTAVNSVALTGVTLTDNFPLGMVLAGNPSPTLVSGACTPGTLSSTPGATSFTITGASIPASSTCTWGVNVSTYIEGSLTNVIPASSMTSAQGSTNNNTPSATLTALRNVGISKYFSPSTIAVNGTSILNLTLVNANKDLIRNNTTFTDTLPAGMKVAAGATTNSCGGTMTAAVGGTTVSLTGVTLGTNSFCAISVPVTAAAVSSYVNTIAVGQVTTTEGSTNPDPATATLLVVNTPGIAKAFGTSPIAVGGSTTLTFTLSNTNATALTGAAFTDNLVNMSIATPGAATGSCTGVGTNLFSAGQTALNFTGLTIPASGSCTVIVNVTSSTAGVNPNTTSGVTTAQTTVAGSPSNTANLTVLLPPTISKSFSPASIGGGDATTMTIIVSNPNSTLIDLAATAAYTDIFPVTPGQMEVASPLVKTSTCSSGGTAGTLKNSSDSSLAAGDIGIQVNGGKIAAGGTCTITVAVTASVAGSYTNTTSTVTGAIAGSSIDVGTASLTVLGQPTISKAFSPATIFAGAASTLTITLTNTNALSAISLATPAFSDIFPTSPGQMMLASPLSASTTCSGAVLRNSAGGALAAGNAGIRLDGGSIPAGASCTVTVSVTASVAGVYNNTTSVLSTTNSGSSLSGGSSTLTVNIAGVSVSGQLYADVNHNMTRDFGESWSAGTTAYVKLFLNCSGTAVSVQTLSPPTGAYVFSGVAAGSYCLVVSNSASAASTAAVPPTGWLNMGAGNGQLNVAVGALDLKNQDFGLYNGSSLSGRVFVDSGAGGGTAADALQNGSEPGLGGATLTATSAGCSGACDSVLSSVQGDYQLWLPAAASGSVTVTKTNPPNYFSSGGVAGNTGGSYTFASDSVTFSHSVGSIYSGVNFADIQPAQFMTDGVQSAMPGSVVFYPHTFTAGISGSVSFSLSSAAAPYSSSFLWNEVLYRDSNCNGAIDAGEPLLTGSVSLSAGQGLCVLVKEFVPLGAPLNALNKVTISAQFVSGSVSSTLSRSDTTTVGQTPDMPLVKSVDKTSALPGSLLTYVLTFTNVSTGLLSNIVVNDATPSFTVFVSAGCGVLPLSLTGCSIIAPAVGATGNVRFTYTGTLAPNSVGAATYTVQIQQ